jgi:hypothetical protein
MALGCKLLIDRLCLGGLVLVVRQKVGGCAGDVVWGGGNSTEKECQ